MLQELLQVRYSFLHLDISFSTFELIILIFLLQTIATSILDYIRVRLHSKCTQQLNFSSKNIFTHGILESDLFHTLDIAILILDLVNIAIASSYNFFAFDYKFLVQLTIPTYKFCLFIHLCLFFLFWNYYYNLQTPLI
jgi:hypothetical protein